ncbi:MAG TPA: FxsB family cyclophane-forming radical SAM/SPASM peptide maturase [Streptosporangiaceae bacterium]|jgi:uncharacterized protein|nr:FxsB family cyclophane-forming radical SAM/SPASM peptide maturase [Streptosporangiaceae bacterium]
MSAAVSQYVLKVHSRCDLACDHCYVYRHADQSWQQKPKKLAVTTARHAAERIAEHAVTHGLGDVHVVLHGGEPLLLGYDGISHVLGLLRSSIEPVTRLNLRIQTNGLLLDEELCGLFASYGVQVGISLDGDRVSHDRHRTFSNGRGSHEDVLRALALLREPEYRHLYAGILCTVDLENDPIAVYEALLAESPPGVDLLLPHATWDRPPRRPANVHAPYAEWLGRIHTRWVADGRPVPIRLFDSMRSAAAGYRSWSEAVGLDPVDLLVIETDGGWEQADSLKTAYHGAPATGFNVFSHSVDDAVAHPAVAARRAGIGALCGTCRACPVVRTCGGGMYAHRHRSRNGFDNPSVYCEDLKALIPQVTMPRKPHPAAPARARDPVANHTLPATAFERLAAGPGDAATMRALAEARWSVTRALVAKAAAGVVGDGALGAAAARGWALLSRLDGERPAAVREILTYPYVQAWAMRCLQAGPDGQSGLDGAHIAGVAAATALRAGITAELMLPVRAGSIYLPGLGALDVDGGDEPIAPVRLSPAGIATTLPVRGWRGVRHFGWPRMAPTVDDVDPFRHCGQWQPTGRLPHAAWRRWRTALAAACRQLTSLVPAYTEVLSAGLRSVVPVEPSSAGYSQSATAPHAFGAVALALPPDVDTLSVLLLHEMQHVKLGVLGELYSLFDRADGRLYRVPWRADPRPVEGVLHGTYAHLAIAEFWLAKARMHADVEAHRRFATYRDWVAEVSDALLDAHALGPMGERFVGGMRSRVRALGS